METTAFKNRNTTMPISTSAEVISHTWTQVSESDCTLSCLNSAAVFNLYVGENSPGESTEYAHVKLYEMTTFAWRTPVWLRLDKQSPNQGEKVTIIK